MIEFIRYLIYGHIPCIFYETTGLYCPGCGGTRATKALLRGEVIRSFRYHPFVLYAFLALILYFVILLKYRVDRKYKPDIAFISVLVYTGLGIILINWGVKDYFLFFHNIDLLRF